MFLRWPDEVDTVAVGPRDLLGRLASSHTWRGLPADPVTLLDLAALPAWELRRPHGWSSFDRAGAALDAATTRAARTGSSWVTRGGVTVIRELRPGPDAGQ
jgi:hypothetical protein